MRLLEVLPAFSYMLIINYEIEYKHSDRQKLHTLNVFNKNKF